MAPALYPDVLAPFRNPNEPKVPTAPLGEDKSPDGKSVLNPPRPTSDPLSKNYESFPLPIDPANNGFDIHIYYFPSNQAQAAHASALREAIRREFPEFRMYRLWDRPIGPHPVAMFEVNVFSPAQLGALIPYLVVNRGPLSVLVHPNTSDEHWDHSTGGFWIGEKFPLDIDLLKRPSQAQSQPEAQPGA